MNKNRIFFLCLILAALTIGAFYFKNKHAAICPRKEAPSVTTPVNISELPQCYGEPIWFVPCDIPVLSGQITFRYGAASLHEENCPGLSQLLACLLDEGAGPYTSQELKRKLVEKKISINIYSDGDHFTVFFRTLASNAQEAFELIKLMLTQPRFADDDVRRVKEQLVANLKQSLHEPNVIAVEAFKKGVFPKNHPYAISTQQKIDSIPNITPDQLRNALKKIATQAAAFVVVAGQSNEKQVTDMVEGVLQDLPKGEALQVPSSLPLEKVTEVKHTEAPFPQVNIVFSFPVLHRQDPNFYAFNFAHQVLISGPLSRLWEEVREKRGLTYGISANLSQGKLLEPFSLGMTATKKEAVQEVIQIIRNVMKEFATSGITEQELEFFKKRIIGGYALGFDSTPKLVKILTSCRLDNLPIDFVSKRNSYYEKLTVQEVNKVIQQVFSPEKLAFVTAGQS